MIKATGIDIVKIRRIKEATERWGERFLSRVFTEDELRYCLSKKSCHESLAVRFAAKEAFIKALGKRIDLRLIEVKNEPSGRPYLNIKSPVANGRRFHLSLSHDDEYAVAVVVMEELQ